MSDVPEKIALTDCVRFRWMLIDILLGTLFVAFMVGGIVMMSTEPARVADAIAYFASTILVFGLPVVLHGMARRTFLWVSHDVIALTAPVVGGFTFPLAALTRLSVYQGMRDRGVSGIYTVETRDGRGGRFVVKRPDWNNARIRAALEVVESQTGLVWQGRVAAQGRGLASTFREFGISLWRGSKASSRLQFALWLLRSCVTIRGELAGIGGGAFRLGTAIVSISLVCLLFLALRPDTEAFGAGMRDSFREGFNDASEEHGSGDGVKRKLSEQLKGTGERLKNEGERMSEEEDPARTAGDYVAAFVAWFSICLGTNVLFTLIRDQVRGRETLESELAAARDVQNRLLPQSVPSVPGFELSGSCIPAYDVGGDYYDFFPLAGGSLAIAVADVSGKGLGAAMLMTLTKGHLATSLDHGADISASLSHLNRRMRQGSSDNRFVSMVVAQIEPVSRLVTVVRAGHNPPLLVTPASGEPRWLQPPGMALGVAPPALFDKVCRAESFTMTPGDVLVLYTDGVTEAMNATAEEYGDERLQRVVLGRHAATADEIRDAVLEDVRAFRGATPPNDDLTITVIKAA